MERTLKETRDAIGAVNGSIGNIADHWAQYGKSAKFRSYVQIALLALILWRVW